ncbi:MAG: MATE family efflux transporter [Halomonas sp.]|uniref:MATE family efflux transporter n=1 Tax=Halomonas sp. TaxID=1486246 RepID=UPI003970ABA0
MSSPSVPGSTSRSSPRRPMRRELLEGPIALTLLRKTLPVIGGMLAMMSFNLVDTWFIARLGTEPLAAVSFTFPVVFTVISLAIGMGIGTSAVVARRLGQGDHEAVRRRATDAALLALAVGLVMTLLGLGAQGVVILAVSSCNALHRSAWAMRLSVVRLFALTVPLAWLGGRLAGTTGVFAGMLAANLVMGGIAWWQTRRLLVEVSSVTKLADVSTTTKG